jgi:hypothetical protein
MGVKGDRGRERNQDKDEDAIKRLHFYANGLRRDTHIAFVFSMPPQEEEEEAAGPGGEEKKRPADTSPASARLVWMYTVVRGRTKTRIGLPYDPARLGWGVKPVRTEEGITALIWKESQKGLSYSLGNIGPRPEDRRFVGPQEKAVKRDLLVLENRGDTPIDLMLGRVISKPVWAEDKTIIGEYDKFQPVLVWKGVKTNHVVMTRFTPMLSAYILDDDQPAYPGTEFVQRKEARRVWHRNLDTLDFNINWKLVEDPSTGKIEVEEGRWTG